MSDLREEIRAILREEIAALQSESTQVSVETVRITNSVDLNRFARDIARRVSQPDFAEKVARGQVTFELSGQPQTSAGAASSQKESTEIGKTLITERDISSLDTTSKTLRLGMHVRLTPLARDEARRRGIRIERNER